MADLKLTQKPFRENLFKRLVTRLVLLAFFNQNLAFATNSIIELDVQGSQTPQRLHRILPSSKIADVSHIEIDADKQQVVVHKLNKADGSQSEKDSVPVSSATKPVILQKHDIQNLPWELEPEKLILFLLNHTAWLNPLGEDGYKLEFRGGLLGGMYKWGNSYRGSQPDGNGGWQLNVPVVKHFQTGGGGFGNSIQNGELMKLSNKQSHFWEEQRKKEEQWRQQTFGVNPTTPSGGYRPSQNSSQPFVFVPKNTSEDSENLKKQQKREEEQRKKQKEIKEKERKERDKKTLTPYLESWNTLYPNRAKKNEQELVADPTTGYKSGMTPEEAQKIYDKWYKGRYEQTLVEEIALPYFKAYYPSLKEVRYDPHISKVVHKDTYQIRPQSFFENDIRQAKDKRVLDPYLESWNKLYPERAKKQYYELASDPDTGYRAGMSPEEAQKVYETWYKGRHEQKASSEGAALFKKAPTPYQVTPVYFAKSASDAGMNPVKALEILTNPTLDNAYERVLLASRQNYLGGSHNLFVFRDIGLTVGEAYDNLLTHLKNNEHFSQLLDEKTNKGIKEGFERFCRERQAIFEDQLVEEWGVKDWREVAEWLDYDAELMQVALKGGKLPNIKDMFGFGEGGGGGGIGRLRGMNKPPKVEIKEQKIEINQIKINNEKVSQANKSIQEYLGKDYKTLTNNQGDKIFISNDGNRKVRFDYKYSHGDKQHVHIEEKDVSGKWKDATSQHRIYFEGDLK